MLALVLTTISLTGLIAGLGTNVAVRVFLPRGSVTLGAFWLVSCWLTPAALLASLLAVIGVGSWVNDVMLGWPHMVTAVWLGVAMFLGNQLLDALNALGKTAFSAFLNALVLFIVVMLALFAMLDTVTLLGILWIYAFSYTLRLIVALLILRRFDLFSWKGGAGDARTLISQGVPLMGLNVGQALTFRLDQLLLGGLKSAHDVGVYAVAATPASAGQVISNSVGQVVFRRVSTGEYRRRQVLYSAFGVLVLTAVFGLVLFFIAPWLIPLLFGPAYTDSVPLLRLLVVAEVCLAPYMVLSRAAAGAKMISVAGWSGMVGLLTMFGTLLFFVPLFGVSGAAIACIFTYSVMTIFTLSAIVFGRWETAPSPLPVEAK